MVKDWPHAGTPEHWPAAFLDLTRLRSKISFLAGDGLSYIEQLDNDSRTAYFIDPPYSVGGKRAGSRLYNHNQLDHARLFDSVARLDGPALLTYDDTPEVRTLACRHNFSVRTIAMKNTHHARLHELLIEKP